MNDAVIVDVVRTASGKGKPGGALSGWHPVDLLATVLKALVERNGLDAPLVDDVIGGCVSQSGEQALNITRTAVLAAGFPEEVPATTLDRQCGSSQQAAHFAAGKTFGQEVAKREIVSEALAHLGDELLLGALDLEVRPDERADEFHQAEAVLGGELLHVRLIADPGARLEAAQAALAIWTRTRLSSAGTPRRRGKP